MRKLLIVDDERTIREGISRCLNWESLGIGTVLTASNGKQAYDMLKKEKIHMVVADIVMPELTGIELIEKCRQENMAVEFVILSSHDDFSFAQKALKNNVCDYILKPCNPEELKNTIINIIEKLDKLDMDNSKFLMAQEKTESLYDNYSNAVHTAIDYINENFMDYNLSLNQIASSVLFMNTDYLGKLFKNECGIKFSNYLLALRMKKAKQLLSSTNLSISCIAEQVGFPDNHTYFSQLFKKYTGVLPKDYKNSLRKK